MDASRIGVDWNGWLLVGKMGSKDVPHARRSRRSADSSKLAILADGPKLMLTSLDF